MAPDLAERAFATCCSPTRRRRCRCTLCICPCRAAIACRASGASPPLAGHRASGSPCRAQHAFHPPAPARRHAETPGPRESHGYGVRPEVPSSQPCSSQQQASSTSGNVSGHYRSQRSSGAHAGPTIREHAFGVVAQHLRHRAPADRAERAHRRLVTLRLHRGRSGHRTVMCPTCGRSGLSHYTPTTADGRWSGSSGYEERILNAVNHARRRAGKYCNV